MAIATTSTLTSLIQEQIQIGLEDPKAPFLFWPGCPLFKQLRFADLAGQGGNAAIFNTRGSLSAVKMTEGEDFGNTQALSNTGVTVTAYSYQVTSNISREALMSLSGPYNEALEYKQIAEEHIRSHMEMLDVEILALASSLTQGAADSGNDMVIADVITALGIMDAANMGTPRTGVISPVMWNDLVKESGSGLASAAVSGQVGESLWGNYKTDSFLGVDWFVNSNVKTDATDAYGMVICPRTIGLVMKNLPELTVEYDASRRTYEMTSVSMWGVGIVEATQGYYLKFGKS